LRRVVAEAGRVMAGEAGGGDGRVGVLELEGETTKLGMVDAGLPVDAAGAVEGTDAREMAGAVAELSGEVEGWVFGTEDLRRDGEWVDAAAGEGGGWIVPVEGGEDARVEAYRVIKALGSRGMRGRLVLAAVGEGAVEVAGKLREVIRKFLAWDAADMFVVGVEGEGFVHGLMSAGGGEGTWAGALGAMVGAMVGAEEVLAVETDPARTVVEAGVGVVREQKGTEPAPEPVRMAIAPVIGELGRDEVEVLEFVGEGAEGVLDSVMAGGEWVGCGLELPGSGRARLAVDGEGRLVVLGVLEDGGDVAELGRAWRWVAENAAVVARAVRPVVADGGKAPEMVVFAGTELAGDLAAVVGAGVRVRTYRALRWGGRRGLLVEAA